jgi:hypothetical protein
MIAISTSENEDLPIEVFSASATSPQIFPLFLSKFDECVEASSRERIFGKMGFQGNCKDKE